MYVRLKFTVRLSHFSYRLHECGLLTYFRCDMMAIAHDSCGERSNNLDDQLALDDEWFSVVGYSTLNKGVICRNETIYIDHESFFTSPSSF